MENIIPIMININDDRQVVIIENTYSNKDVDTEKMINAFGSILSNKKQSEFKYSNYKVTKLITPKIISKTVIILLLFGIYLLYLYLTYIEVHCIR